MNRTPGWIACGALLTLAATAVAAWSAVLGGSATRAVAAAAPVALVLVSRRPGRVALVAVVAWLPAAVLLAGVPRDALAPGAGSELLDGMRRLLVPDAVRAVDPWPLAIALLLLGLAWITAAALAREHRGAAFSVAAAPWIAAVLLAGANVTVWQGAAVVAAGMLWHPWTRTSPVAAVALAIVVALLSAVTGWAVASQGRWLEMPGVPGFERAPFRALDTEPTFEPIRDGRDGAPMLEIRATEPALWRMQALDVFDGRTWRASSHAPLLPEPAGEPARIDVRVRGLLNGLVVAPGRIEHITAAATVRSVAGGASELWPTPEAGDEYRVDASVVVADARRLRRAEPPLTPGVAAYTRLGLPDRRAIRIGGGGQHGFWVLPPGVQDVFTDPQPSGFPVQLPPFGSPPSPRAARALASTPYRDVAALARRLATGARSQWDVVERVQSYLVDGHRFRYTTDVPPPGELPLVDFLLRTHAGYCQHFAGAAALLLRMAGVPSRMVTGFATGVRTEHGFVARDVDAHAWIEVYFEGLGWVPFNPTPASADAAVASELDPLATTGKPRGGGGSLAIVLAVAIAAAAALAGRAVRRRPTLEEALARLAARSGMPIGPSTTLGEVHHALARVVGPRTSALAAEAERARFGPRAPRRSTFPRTRVARAIVADAGLWRAALLVLAVRCRITQPVR